MKETTVEIIRWFLMAIFGGMAGLIFGHTYLSEQEKTFLENRSLQDLHYNCSRQLYDCETRVFQCTVDYNVTQILNERTYENNR